MKLTFLGAVGTVTGSKFLLETKGKRLLIDCGLFQGFKQLRLRNWAPLPYPPGNIDTVILTHAHLDHSGYVPLLVKNGFRGNVFATPGTCALCSILLPDSGYLQEKDAEFAARYGFSRHHPARPLYTEADAKKALTRFRPVAFAERHDLADGLSVRFHPAGHILGAAIVELDVEGRRIIFSGDLGRPDSPALPSPAVIGRADYLLVESTYGDRLHDRTDPEEALALVIGKTAARGGTILVPSFAVGRAQILLYHLYRLKKARRIPDLPIYLDSPMAIDATELYCRFHDEHKLSASDCKRIFGVARYVRTVDESKALNKDPMPKIIISASGMATGGRVLHHLKHYAPDPKNSILFTGFQAGGTRGDKIVKGARSVKIHGAYIPVEAEVIQLSMLSAHADSDEIMAWLRQFERPPQSTFIVHGEMAASDALRHRIEEELGWHVYMPDYRETVDLS